MRSVWGFRLLTILCVFCLASQTSWAQVGHEPREYVGRYTDPATTYKKMDIPAKKGTVSIFVPVGREDPTTWPKTQKWIQSQKSRASATSSKASSHFKHPGESYQSSQSAPKLPSFQEAGLNYMRPSSGSTSKYQQQHGYPAPATSKSLSGPGFISHQDFTRSHGSRSSPSKATTSSVHSPSSSSQSTSKTSRQDLHDQYRFIPPSTTHQYVPLTPKSKYGQFMF